MGTGADVSPAVVVDAEGVAGGELVVLGQIRDASNGTFLASVDDGDGPLLVVYKPVAGERPLWDFPDGTLAAREALAYRVSRHMGLGCVPVTVLRDGPLGVGSGQVWVDGAGEPVRGEVDVTDPGFAGEPGAGVVAITDVVPDGWHHVLAVTGDDGSEFTLAHADSEELRRLALFDVVSNNTDRKLGHVVGCAGRVAGIDNGLTFHEDFKVRTVLWGFAGQAFTGDEVAALARAGEAAASPSVVQGFAGLTRAEREAFAARVESLGELGCFPAPPPGRTVIPWPPW